MADTSWNKMWDAFHLALEREGAERETFLAAEFGDEPALRLERLTNAIDDAPRLDHTMERGGREDSIKFICKRKILAVHIPDAQSALRGGIEQIVANIDTFDKSPSLCNPLCDHAVSASKIQDTLAGPWR